MPGDTSRSQDNSLADFELGAIVTRSLALFRFVFSESVALAISAFTDAGSLPPASDVSAVWGIWSVVQRGHNATDFESCIVEAWKMCELVPTLLLRVDGTTVPTCETDTMLLRVDIERNSDHMQLVASMARIVADSMAIPVPPGTLSKAKRCLLLHVGSRALPFSIIHTILTSFHAHCLINSSERAARDHGEGRD